MITIMFLLFYIILFTIIICSIRLGEYLSRKEHFNKIDFKNKDYYRDILKKFSAAEISYIDNLKIETKKDIVTTLLNLKLKNKIEINENKITILDRDTSNLKKTEKFILQNVKNGRVNIYCPEHFKLFFEAEAFEDKLISKKEKNNTNKLKYTNKYNLCILILIISFVALIIDYEYLNFLDAIDITKLLILISISLFAIVFSYAFYIAFSPTVHVRTQKGEKLNKKIKGLKKYIQDYSNLSEKDKNDLILWNEYLIYSVIFGINTQIVDELIELIYFENAFINTEYHSEICEKQIIYIDNTEYITKNFIEYAKDNTIIKKYKLLNTNNTIIWLVIEINISIGINYYLYNEYKSNINIHKNKILIKNNQYTLYRKGETCLRKCSYSSNYSKTNYCKYFDYISKDTNFNNIISLEYWNGTKKIYIGTKIAPDRIKIQPTYNEQMQ